MGTPQYPQDFGSMMKGVNDRIRSAATQAQSRKPFKTIKTAILTLIGSLVVRGGGSIKVIDDNGVELVTVGRIGFSGTGAPVTGVQIKRPNNKLALTSYSTADGSFDFNGLWDRNGTIVMSDDGQSGQGMATPWLPLPLPMPLTRPQCAQTSSRSMALVSTCHAYATHPNLNFEINGQTDAGFAGEMALFINGTQVGSTQTVPAGGNVNLSGTKVPMPGWGTTLNYLDQIVIEVQARVTTAGTTGQIYVLPLKIYGVQS